MTTDQQLLEVRLVQPGTEIACEKTGEPLSQIKTGWMRLERAQAQAKRGVVEILTGLKGELDKFPDVADVESEDNYKQLQEWAKLVDVKANLPTDAIRRKIIEALQPDEVSDGND